MRRIGVIVGAAGHREAVPDGRREVSIRVIRRVAAVMRFERVESGAREPRNQVVAREQAGMRERCDAP